MFPDLTMRQLQQRLKKDADIDKKVDSLSAKVDKLESQMSSVMADQKLILETHP